MGKKNKINKRGKTNKIILKDKIINDEVWEK